MSTGIRVALALLGAAAVWPRPMAAQDSPEALVEAFVESVRVENQAGLRELVHPAAPGR